MFPRTFLGVLALVIMLTGILVAPAMATTDTFEIAFDLSFPSHPAGVTNPVSGKFFVTFDPAGPSSSGFQTVQFQSVTGVKAFGSLGSFQFFDGSAFALEVSTPVDISTTTVDQAGTLFITTAGWNNIPSGVHLTEGAITTLPPPGTTFFADLDISTINEVPLPPGFVLLGTGLLGLAGWRRFRKG